MDTQKVDREVPVKVPIPVVPYYVPNGSGYTVLVMGDEVFEIFRGKSGWWLITQLQCLFFKSLREAEGMVKYWCDRIGDA